MDTEINIIPWFVVRFPLKKGVLEGYPEKLNYRLEDGEVVLTVWAGTGLNKVAGRERAWRLIHQKMPSLLLLPWFDEANGFAYEMFCGSMAESPHTIEEAIAIANGLRPSNVIPFRPRR